MSGKLQGTAVILPAKLIDMGRRILRGFVTFAEIASHLNISTRTLNRKIQPFRPFLMKGQIRKKLYSPEEWRWLIKNLRENSALNGH